MNVEPWLGILSLVGVVAVVSGLIYALHLIARPHGGHDPRETESLSALFVRGGRQRFSIRLFEAGLLATLWSTGGAVLLLWSTVRSSDGRTLLALAGVAGPLSIATWWAWRRGVLRPISRTEDVNLLALQRRRRARD
jgi:hypothetical protein